MGVAYSICPVHKVRGPVFTCDWCGEFVETGGCCFRQDQEQRPFCKICGKIFCQRHSGKNNYFGDFRSSLICKECYLEELEKEKDDTEDIDFLDETE
jgi:hypothetical protein